MLRADGRFVFNASMTASRVLASRRWVRSGIFESGCKRAGPLAGSSAYRGLRPGGPAEVRQHAPRGRHALQKQETVRHPLMCWTPMWSTRQPTTATLTGSCIWSPTMSGTPTLATWWQRSRRPVHHRQCRAWRAVLPLLREPTQT